MKSCVEPDFIWREIFQALVQRLRKNNLADSSYVSVEEQLGIFFICSVKKC
jgi:hypothetical protein